MQRGRTLAVAITIRTQRLNLRSRSPTPPQLLLHLTQHHIDMILPTPPLLDLNIFILHPVQLLQNLNIIVQLYQVTSLLVQLLLATSILVQLLQVSSILVQPLQFISITDLLLKKIDIRAELLQNSPTHTHLRHPPT